MYVVRFNPMRELMQMQDRLTSLLEDGLGTVSATSLLPATDMYEEDGRFVIEASLPGFKEEEIEVNVNNGGLEIKAQHDERSEEKDKDRKFLIRELTSGSFYRYVNLPAGANVDEAQAKFADGVLKVVVPLDQPKSRRLSLSSGQGESHRTLS